MGAGGRLAAPGGRGAAEDACGVLFAQVAAPAAAGAEDASAAVGLVGELDELRHLLVGDAHVLGSALDEEHQLKLNLLRRNPLVPRYRPQLYPEAHRHLVHVQDAVDVDRAVLRVEVVRVLLEVGLDGALEVDQRLGRSVDADAEGELVREGAAAVEVLDLVVEQVRVGDAVELSVRLEHHRPEEAHAVDQEAGGRARQPESHFVAHVERPNEQDQDHALQHGRGQGTECETEAKDEAGRWEDDRLHTDARQHQHEDQHHDPVEQSDDRLQQVRHALAIAVAVPRLEAGEIDCGQLVGELLLRQAFLELRIEDQEHVLVVRRVHHREIHRPHLPTRR
mmetsp:Transcript_1737/g.6185  ORF Transcript_1737/g.6185 Transcript_1737/m.6185 type:complete len:337 (-) Transcript_1737:1088-2098(-)